MSTIFQTNYIQVLAAAGVEQIVLYPAVVCLLGGVTKKDIETIRLMSNELPVLGKIVDIFGIYMGRIMDISGRRYVS